MNINEALVSSSITSSIYIIYKTIQHYRLKSECNKDNELVVGIVDLERGQHGNQSNPLENNQVIAKEGV